MVDDALGVGRTSEARRRTRPVCSMTKLNAVLVFSAMSCWRSRRARERVERSSLRPPPCGLCTVWLWSRRRSSRPSAARSRTAAYTSFWSRSKCRSSKVTNSRACGLFAVARRAAQPRESRPPEKRATSRAYLSAGNVNDWSRANPAPGARKDTSQRSPVTVPSGAVSAGRAHRPGSQTGTDRAMRRVQRSKPSDRGVYRSEANTDRATRRRSAAQSGDGAYRSRKSGACERHSQ